MRKYAYATLCGTLLFSGKAAFAIETSLLDRLAQERIIGDGQARPRPIRSLTARRAARSQPGPGAQRQRGTRRPVATGERTAPGTGTEAGRDGTGQRAAHRAAGAAAGPGSRSPESSALAAEQEQNQARIRELGQRLEDTQAQRDALAAELASARTATAGNASQDSALSAALGAARTEIASLKQQATDLQAANQQLRDQQLRDQQAAQAAQQAKTDKTGGAGRVVINDTAPRTCASAMRSAPGTRKARRRKPRSSRPSARSWTCRRSRRASPTRSTIACSCPRPNSRPNSTARNSSWKPPCCPRMKREQGPAGGGREGKRRGQDAGRRDLQDSRQRQVAERVGQERNPVRHRRTALHGRRTGPGNSQQPRQDLPPLFQSIVKQLGLGGSAKILTP